MRYTDDLLSLDNTWFEQEIPIIYLPQLILKKMTETADRLSYLDSYTNRYYKSKL